MLRVLAARGHAFGRRFKPASIVENRIARLDALLIGAWCAFDGYRFDEHETNKETIMCFLSMARDEVKALQRLPVEVTNIEC
jgi:hypothetical protein